MRRWLSAVSFAIKHSVDCGDRTIPKQTQYPNDVPDVDNSLLFGAIVAVSAEEGKRVTYSLILSAD